MSAARIIWIISEGSPGHVSQSTGLAAALAEKFPVEIRQFECRPKINGLVRHMIRLVGMRKKGRALPDSLLYGPIGLERANPGEPAPDLIASAIKTTEAVLDDRRASDYYRVVDGGQRLLWGGRITTRAASAGRTAGRTARCARGGAAGITASTLLPSKVRRCLTIPRTPGLRDAAGHGRPASRSVGVTA